MDTDQIENALREIDAEIVEAERALEQLRLQKLGATALLDRLGKKTGARGTLHLSGGAASSSDGGSPSVGNKDLVEELLRPHPEGLRLSEIQQKAEEAGRPLNSEQVRSAVTYLKRQNKADAVRRGVWRLIPVVGSINAEATVGAVASDVPGPTTERSGDQNDATSSSAEADDLDHSRMGATVGGY